MYAFQLVGRQDASSFDHFGINRPTCFHKWDSVELPCNAHHVQDFPRPANPGHAVQIHRQQLHSKPPASFSVDRQQLILHARLLAPSAAKLPIRAVPA